MTNAYQKKKRKKASIKRKLSFSATQSSGSRRTNEEFPPRNRCTRQKESRGEYIQHDPFSNKTRFLFPKKQDLHSFILILILYGVFGERCRTYQSTYLSPSSFIFGMDKALDTLYIAQ